MNSRSPRSGAYVLYWMQQAQRATGNAALEMAVDEANRLKLPVLVFFGLTADFPEANWRHYRFMIEGLRETADALRERGLGFAAQAVSPPEGAIRLAGDAALAVVDAGCLRVQRAWRRQAADAMPCPLFEVESDTVVPVRTASDRLEYAARTFRPRVNRHRDRFLVPLDAVAPRHDGRGVEPDSLDLSDADALRRRLDLRDDAPAANWIRGGHAEAARRLRDFIERDLDVFGEDRNDPGRDRLSNMSPYLHFGQIGPVEVALAVQAARSPGTESYLEELIVRRELSVNYVTFQPAYDRYEALPEWARRTLDKHAADPRPRVYSPARLEAGKTDDPCWNAAMREMILRGKMHGYMRMYWGKKILEWSASPAAAYRTALRLNNRYFLDGRDPNGFAGVAWCFGLHDRPWGERPVFGTVRCMTAAGLRRKFDMDAYIRRVEEQWRDSAANASAPPNGTGA